MLTNVAVENTLPNLECHLTVMLAFECVKKSTTETWEFLPRHAREREYPVVPVECILVWMCWCSFSNSLDTRVREHDRVGGSLLHKN